MSFGLCVLGCGSFARVFARSIAELRGEVDLYFASRDLARAREYATRYDGLGAFGSYEAAAADPRVDAVYVCTPHHLHLEHVALAAREGKHALVEKPIAGTLDDAKEMVRQSDAAGVTLMVAENYRFLPAVREARRLIDQGRLGRVRLIQLNEQFPFLPTGWRNRRDENGGGVLIDGGIHKVSALAYLAGRPDQVYAREVLPGQPGLDGEDGVVIITNTDDGVVGIINHSWSAAPPTPNNWVSVSGSAASVYFEAGQPWVRLTDANGETALPVDNYPNGLAPMTREFIQSVRERRNPGMDGLEGIADLAVVIKAYESIELDAPVRMD